LTRARDVERGGERLFDRRLDVLLQLIRRPTKAWPRLGRRAGDGLHQRRDEPILPRQVLVAKTTKVGLTGGGGRLAVKLRPL
jgi:hypothetical protein